MSEPTIVVNPKGLSEAAKKKGIEIKRRVVGHAYSRNGNAHNPTERVTFEAWYEGRLIGSSSRMAYCVDIANEYAEPEEIVG